MLPIYKGHGIYLTDQRGWGILQSVRDIRLPELFAVKNGECDIEPVDETEKEAQLALGETSTCLFSWFLQSHKIMFERPQNLLQDLPLILTRRNSPAHTLPPSRNGGIEHRLPRITRVDIVWVAVGFFGQAGPLGGHMLLNDLGILRDHGPDNQD